MDKTKQKEFQKWIVKEVGIQDASIFSKDSLVEKVAIDYRDDFKAALKEELERKTPDIINDDMQWFSLNELRDLIDQVKPKS